MKSIVIAEGDDNKTSYYKIPKSFEAQVIRSLEKLTDASNSNQTERPNLELSDSSKRTSRGFETSSDYTCPACVLNVWSFSSICHWHSYANLSVIWMNESIDQLINPFPVICDKMSTEFGHLTSEITSDVITHPSTITGNLGSWDLSNNACILCDCLDSCWWLVMQRLT